MNVLEVFALDIGTRKIAGLLLSPTEQGFMINQASLYQQLPGAMADGQIHHIDAVSQVIKKIKMELETTRGTPLNKVAVAAAGRSLITQTGSSTIALAPNQRLGIDSIRALELDGVRSAIDKLSTSDGGGVMDSYLCVGYTVTQYSLDGAPIGSLLNHQGNEAQVEIIATFLPRIVINSLGTALDNAGLKMESLTLEPIAAMHVVVPPTMRMLNIALVDVGAGTSDLAISSQGTIKGYGMVSYAGDAITAGIADHFLLDSTVAEQVKIQIQPNQTMECQDVFGNNLTLKYEDVLSVIYPRVQILAEKIATEILRLNDGAPKGVILVGGGSLTPELAPLLAKNLDLPEHLVRMRSRSSLQTIEGVPEFNGPEVITPIGIGCTHLDGRAMELVHVSVDDQPVQFLKMASSTVGDALLQAGLIPGELVGRPGRAFTVELNGRCITLPGTLGQPATILNNGVSANLNTPLADGDKILVTPGQQGHSPLITLDELTEASTYSFEFILNNSPIKIKPKIMVNGKKAALDYILQDRDKITLQPITNFKELFVHLEIPVEQETQFYLNGQSKTVLEKIQLFKNGVKESLSTPLGNGLQIKYYHKQCTLRDICTPEKESLGITIKVNNKKLELAPKNFSPVVNGQKVSLDYVIKPQDRIQYEPQVTGALNSYIVTDVFREFKPDETFLNKGGLILVNGVEAGFTTPIKHGDVLEFLAYGVDMVNS